MRKTILLSMLLFCGAGAFAEPVKLSKSGICHDPGSSHYSRTKNYTSFDSLQACLDSGGRLPKSNAVPASKSAGKYKRDYFEHWSDDDKNCINTRHELLMRQSTSTVDTGKNKCTAERGRWIDPYTGNTFYNARDLDIDHVIPLKWAWDHGADRWSPEKRKQFANDEANLFAVKASVNREKGALGVLDWLPPDKKFHCQYVTRWKRLLIKYKLVLSSSERAELDNIFRTKCPTKQRTPQN